MNEKAKIGILRWEAGHVPEGLMQLEKMAGNSTNPSSYPFEVKMEHVEGACVDTIITNPSPVVLQRMIDTSKKLIEEDGVRAICTSCGFNAIFQREMADALPVPVFSSSILQVPFVQNIIGLKKTVGVITANKGSLTKEHMANCGITDDMNVEVFGLENAEQFSKIFDNPNDRFDIEAVTEEILGTAEQAVKDYPQIGAFVLECTDLPPFAARIREKLDLPVFDFNSMMGYVAMSLNELKLY